MIPETRALQPLRILFLEHEKEENFPHAAELRERGHVVVCADRLDGLPAVHGFDVIVVAEGDDRFRDAAAVLKELAVIDVGVPAVAVGEEEDFDRCRRAMRHGAVDYLVHPVDADSFVHTVESAALHRSPGFGGTSFVRHYFHGFAAHERALRELGAHLLESGLGAAHRARITTAVALVLRHFLECRGDSPLRVESERTGGNIVVSLGALGESSLGSVCPALPSPRKERGERRETPHLSRARALAEELETSFGSSFGEVRLTFVPSPVRFEEEDLDLSEADYLDPHLIEHLLSLVPGELETRPHVIPPSMTSTVGRLLAIANSERAADAPLRS